MTFDGRGCRWALALTALAAASSCGSRQYARMGNTPAAPSAVTTVFERQIRNAQDAGDGDLELAALRERVTARPYELKSRLRLAAAYEMQGAPELAADHYRIALDHHPESQEAAERLADALTRSGQREPAISVLASFADRSADVAAPFLSRLAIRLDEAGMADRGEMYHRRAIEASPQQDALRNNLGYNFLMRKHYDEAVHEFRAALVLNSKSVTARNNLAWALANRGGAEDVQEAVLQWQSLAGPAAARSNLAAVLIEQGKYAAAREQLGIASGHDSRHPAVLRNLQVVAELDGKRAAVAVQQPMNEAETGGSDVASFLGRIFGKGKKSAQGSSGGDGVVAKRQ